jgi:hypothetical protein
LYGYFPINTFLYNIGDQDFLHVIALEFTKLNLDNDLDYKTFGLLTKLFEEEFEKKTNVNIKQLTSNINYDDILDYNPQKNHQNKEFIKNYHIKNYHINY